MPWSVLILDNKIIWSETFFTFSLQYLLILQKVLEKNKFFSLKLSCDKGGNSFVLRAGRIFIKWFCLHFENRKYSYKYKLLLSIFVITCICLNIWQRFVDTKYDTCVSHEANMNRGFLRLLAIYIIYKMYLDANCMPFQSDRKHLKFQKVSCCFCYDYLSLWCYISEYKNEDTVWLPMIKSYSHFSVCSVLIGNDFI